MAPRHAGGDIVMSCLWLCMAVQQSASDRLVADDKGDEKGRGPFGLVSLSV